MSPSLNLTAAPAADLCLSGEARDLHRRRNEGRFTAETTPVPLLTLFALNALLDLEALKSNNVRGGTCLAEAGGAKKSGWIEHPVSRIEFRVDESGNESDKMP